MFCQRILFTLLVLRDLCFTYVSTIQDMLVQEMLLLFAFFPFIYSIFTNK